MHTRQPIAQQIGKACEPVGTASQVCLRRLFVAPRPQRCTQAGIIPPMGMKSRKRADDHLTLRLRRRQWPGRGNDVRVAQIFQQQVPRVRFRIPEGFEALRYEACGRCRSNVGVERNLLTTGVPRRTGAIRMCRFQDQRCRCALNSAVTGQAQPQDTRQHRRARALDRDLAHPLHQRSHNDAAPL